MFWRQQKGAWVATTLAYQCGYQNQITQQNKKKPPLEHQHNKKKMAIHQEIPDMVGGASGAEGEESEISSNSVVSYRGATDTSNRLISAQIQGERENRQEAAGVEKWRQWWGREGSTSVEVRIAHIVFVFRVLSLAQKQDSKRLQSAKLKKR